jgi:hypothetical protein
MAQRPFRSLAHLKQVMAQIVRDAGRERQLALIRAHPELAGKAMVSNTLTAESTHEQSKAGPDQLHARGICANPDAQRRLQREIRLSFYPGRARPARHRTVQARHH